MVKLLNLCSSLITERMKIFMLCLSLFMGSFAVVDLTPAIRAGEATLSATLQEDSSFFAIEIYAKKAESLEPKPLIVVGLTLLHNCLPEAKEETPVSAEWPYSVDLHHRIFTTSVGNHSPPSLS